MASHTVKKGDTLHGISAKYYGRGALWRLLKIYNRISDADKIEVGDVVKIPFVRATA